MGALDRSLYFADEEALSAASEQATSLLSNRHSVIGAANFPPPAVLTRDDLAAKARTILRGRRARDRLFGGSGMFGEPAWDMMLDLFVAEADGEKVTMSSAAASSHVPPTTALRWIDKLVKVGLFEREADQFDRRRHYLRLSERAEELVRLAITGS